MRNSQRVPHADDPRVMESSPPAPHGTLPDDAIVSVMGGLVFVTTGQQACEQLGEYPTQVALTPVVAARISEVLKVILQYPDLPTRESIVAEWNQGEAGLVPHGRVLIDMTAVRFGIEPLGAGALVAVLWEAVPPLVITIDRAVRGMQAAKG